MAMRDVKSAGSTYRSASIPRITSREKSAPPSGTPYAAPIPAPAPQATNRRRCSSERRPLSAKKLAKTAPACLGAPSRPSEPPIPTTKIERMALPSVRTPGSLPAWNQMAAVVSMPLALVSCFRMIWPAPVTKPAPSSARMWRSAPAWTAASRMLVPEPFHVRCWTSSSSRVSAAAPMPVVIPVSTIAGQKLAAAGCRRLKGI